MENVKRFHLTEHSIRRLSERGIGSEEIKYVVRNHQDKVFVGNGDHGGKIYKFSRTTSGGKVTVVAELKKSDCWVITTYHE